MELANIAFIVVAIAIGLTLYKMVFNPGAAASQILQNKLIKMGTIKGRSYDEIAKIIGPPTVTQTTDSGLMRSWNTQKYAINLGFDKDGICTGVFGEKRIK